MQIDYLADHPALIPVLAEWYFQEWGWLRPDRTLHEQIDAVGECCNRGGVPTAVVALNEEQLCGGALLVEEDMETRPDLTPWLAGVFVNPHYRGLGVASRLVNRIVEEAGRCGRSELFLYTWSAETLYHRLGWEVVDRCEYRGHQVAVMVRRLVR